MTEVVVGVVGRAHGVRGDVAIDVRTDEPDRRFADGAVLREEGGTRTFTVADARDHSGRLLVHFADVPDRTAAEALRGVRLVVDVDPDETPEGEGEFYDRQLVGLRVLDRAGAPVGVVREVIHLPLQDLLEITTDHGPRLVPFVTELVPNVDLSAGQLTLAEVPGLLSDLDE